MPNSSHDTSSMEQVRELLMGTHLKEMEKRLQRQEERFMQEVADLRDTVKKRLESLENFMKSESSSLMHRVQEEKAERTAAFKNEHRERTEALKAEQREREKSFAQTAKDLAKTEEAIERRLTALSATLDTVEQEMRQLLLAESARLSDSVEEKYKDALLALSRTTAQLRHDLVSRVALSALFTENAFKLASDLPPVNDKPSVAEAKPGAAEPSGS